MIEAIGSLNVMDNIKGLKDNNTIQESFPKLNDTEIVFNGEGNILYCEEGVSLKHLYICFDGNNSLAYLGSNRGEYELNLTLNNDNVFHMGKDNGITARMTVILSEQRHCFIGNHCLFALGIWIRNADPHLIYDCNSGKRINPSKSVYIGDHVWIGQNSLILKGAQISSGSIIGGNSVVSGKRIPHNSIWGGNPVRKIRDQAFWDAACVHQWTKEQPVSSVQYEEYLKYHNHKSNPDKWIYEYNEEDAIGFNKIEIELNSLGMAREKCDYLINLDGNTSKNRFVQISKN